VYYQNIVLKTETTLYDIKCPQRLKISYLEINVRNDSAVCNMYRVISGFDDIYWQK